MVSRVACLLPSILACFAIALSAAPATAGTPLWGQMTLEDLRAARQHIVENHPGALPDLGDAAFLANLADFPRFEEMAARVRTLGGYRAVLDRFAASFGDRHVARYPIIEPASFWPGFLVGKRGDSWLVTNGTSDLPVGSTLASCDGRSPAAMAETNLTPYTSDPSLRAQQQRAAAMLFVAQGDPFITLPRSCVFHLADGNERTLVLNWEPIGKDRLAHELATARREVAIANSLTPFRNGWWLRLGTFQDPVRPTVEQFVAARERLSGTSFVIVDVRGNTGGSSAYGNILAETLYGSDAVARAQRAIDSRAPRTGQRPVQGEVWRASPGNLSLIEETVARFTQELGASNDTTLYFIRSRDAMRTALASGAKFSIVPDSGGTDAARQHVVPLRNPPRIFLLTDFACFSACLEAVQLFRELGATQIGEDTDGGLNYFEVRAVPLPSGLSYFSTLQAYSPSRPHRLGPFDPVDRYDGDPADETQVEAWVASLVERPPSRHRIS